MKTYEETVTIITGVAVSEDDAYNILDGDREAITALVARLIAHKRLSLTRRDYAAVAECKDALGAVADLLERIYGVVYS